MIDTTTVLDAVRGDLAAELRRTEPTSAIKPMPHSRYVLLSALQKSIRRGNEPIALNCTAALLNIDPDKFWRRLAVIAFEDVGIGDLETVARVTAVTGNKRWRDAHGGNQPIANYLVRRLCRAVKDRTTDDLCVVAEHHPDLDQARLEWTFLPQGQLLDTIARTQSLKRQALSAWFAAGTSRFQSDVLRERRGDPSALFDFYSDLEIDPVVVEVCRAGLSKSNCVLPAFLPLVWKKSRRAARHVEQDVLTECPRIDGIPACALDRFTREGKVAIAGWVKQSGRLRDLLAALAPEQSWSFIAARLLFRAEASLVNKRLRWDGGCDLRAHADTLGRGIPPEAVPEALEVVRAELPLLNEIRASMIRQEGK